MPQSQVSRGLQSSLNDGTTTGGSNGETDSSSTSTTPTNWNFFNNNTNVITLNVTNLNPAYIVGSEVETYLNKTENNSLVNFNNITYCLISDFKLGTSNHQLRTRVIPISFYNYTTKKISRIFRADFDNTTIASTACAQNTPAAPSGTITHYDPNALCPNCSTTMGSTVVKLYKVISNTTLELVPISSINLNPLRLGIDPNVTGAGVSGSCTNSECVSRGFDCCLENQCVKDGATRPNASTNYSAELTLINQQRQSDPKIYLNYPHLYYVCGMNIPPIYTGATNGSLPNQEDYTSGIAQLKKDYECVEQINETISTEPFHLEFLNASYELQTPAPKCSAVLSNIMHPRKVLERLYITCGCPKDNLINMINNCPAYEYEATLRDANGTPTQINCYTPPAVPEIPQVQTANVSSRSAPHRFFTTDSSTKEIFNMSYKGLSGLIKNTDLSLITEKNFPWKKVKADAAYIQEGNAFSYTGGEYIYPDQTTNAHFNMNAILGSISVGLDLAHPAKMVKVELDASYIISTVSGYFTPCPTCNKDSWNTSFTAFGSSSHGVGLQAIGFTTERDTLGSNFTGGNYEDTIFGRACWVPPTMLPFSHQQINATLQTQRLYRLKTQAALYANGYQRDWFGFNKGALIGSFDGVSWFAVGKGRIVRATSDKLFLAINAPFADLSNPSFHSVQVQLYDGIFQAPGLDYDPSLSQTHPHQNEAGNCQAYHMCSTDKDCITKLGWEYACSDVSGIKTLWPKFDAYANETSNAAQELYLYQILHQKSLPKDTKRCVYRGAGAPCINNADAIPNVITRSYH